MTTTIHSDPVPLRIDAQGSIRVGDTRVTLDLVVREYERGTSPEEMVRAYDVLNLADVHGAIAYYLRHREEVSGYLQLREIEAERVRAEIEANQPYRTRRKEELQARWARVENEDAAAGQ